MLILAHLVCMAFDYIQFEIQVVLGNNRPISMALISYRHYLLFISVDLSNAFKYNVFLFLIECNSKLYLNKPHFPFILFYFAFLFLLFFF